VAGPIVDAEGNLFGTTQMGGGNNLDGNSGGAGTVYALQNNGASWTEVVLHSFCSAAQCADGAYPFGTIKLGADSKFLGVTAVGGGKCDLNGILGCGVLFKLTNNGENSIETVLHTFCVKKNCKDGAEPVSTPALDASGNFLGTTNLGGGNNIDRFGQGGGVVYRLSGDAFDYKLLHSFCSTANCADGEYPEGEVVIDPDGDFIGTTSLGGLNGSDTEGGTVFSLRTAP
jgi:hypothetical protein